MIAVIGGGPVGCYTASLLAKKGKKIALFEEHKSIGKPVQCTGIVTSSINNIIKVKKSIVLNKIKRARIIAGKSSVELRLKNKNLVLDREKFDKSLAEKAESAGARLFPGHKYIGNKGKKVITSRKKVNASNIIGADGPLSPVAKANGMFGKRKFLTGFQARLRIKNDNCVEFYPKIGTIAWVVPENREIVRIGVLAEKNAKKMFESFISKKAGKRGIKKSIIEYQGGLVPIYNPRQITQKINQKSSIYLVGDAACQVKATTGGGIIQGLAAAEALAESIINNKNYEKSWKKRLGKDLRLHLLMRNMMDKFSSRDWESLISIFSREKPKSIIESYDRDYPVKFIIRLLLSEPRLLYFARHLF